MRKSVRFCLIFAIPIYVVVMLVYLHNTMPPPEIIINELILNNNNRAIECYAKFVLNKQLSYQWYVNEDDGKIGTLIEDETRPTYYIPTDKSPGTYYFFCVVSSPDAASKKSDNIQVVIPIK